MPQHPWVEDYANFEAVLVCTNELPTWDAAAVMRGFQTYLFDDATTPGDESSYTHSNTGGIVRYEDGVLAIDFGHGDLASMLPDLLSALYALGWRRAEVYHPAESIDALLADIGRAIPAHQDFDVVAAQEKPIFEQPEARSLLTRAVSGVGDREIISAEFESLGNAATNKVFANLAPAGPIRLMDDEREDGDETGEIVVNMGVTTAHMDEEPLVPDLSAGDDLRFTPSPVVQSAGGMAGAMERERLEAAIREQVRQEEERAAAKQQQGEIARLAREQAERDLVGSVEASRTTGQRAASSQGAAPAHAQAPRAPQRPAAIAADGLVGAGAGFEDRVSTIRAGQCTFYFPPVGEVSDREAFEALVSGLDDATFLYPGGIKESVRWDVLDEIQPSSPWMAEKLSSLAGFAGMPGNLVAAIMLAVKKDMSYASLRDVLAFVGKDINAMGADMLKVSPEAEMVLAHTEAIGGLGGAMDAITQKFGALALCPPGCSFVDILAGPDELAPEMTESFSVRSLVESGVSRTFVVYVDAADGPFTSWLAELLRGVVTMHSLSLRSCAMATPQAKAEVVEEAVVAPDEFKRLQESMSLLMEQMTKLSGGIPKAAG